METKKDDVCLIIDKLLSEMGNDEKIKKTPLNQIATTMGIVIDKFTLNESTIDNENSEDDGFIDALNDKAEEIEWNDEKQE